MSLLELLPKPLLEDFLRDRWLPVVGAGFSKNAHHPLGHPMPDWRELADGLTAQLDGYEPQDPVDALSAYAEEYGRSRLIEKLGELLLIRDVKPGAAHLAFADVAFDLVLTTNFDFLLEQAYAAVGQSCRPLLSEAQLPQSPPERQAQLLKLHGDLNHPNEMVATEEDFDTFLAQRPLMATFTANLLITRTPVLIGYSFDDPDTRALWALIQSRIGKLRRRAYALKIDATDTEVERFRRRGVNVVNLPGQDYGRAFTELFEELQVAYNRDLGRTSRPTDDEVAAQLVLPAEEPSRLCFCSVPRSLLSWYRREIFPVIEEAGYVPVTPEEVVSPDGNVLATTRALLARAALALIDGATYNAAFELRMALAHMEPQQVIAVVDKQQPLPSSMGSVKVGDGMAVVGRDENLLADPEIFREEIASRLGRSIVPQLAQPRRLLKQGHFDAALVMAFSALEQRLTKAIEPVVPERPPSIGRLIDAAAERGLVSPDERAQFRYWQVLRNSAVHQGADIAADQAREAVRGIEAVLKRLDSRRA
ncbi:MAG TPA: SIR2 family protein [Thermoleophilaceae bacterium]|nr:SIR2 family protein [Thermoleophilaceae bacterium]